jgi:hypothetical protein
MCEDNNEYWEHPTWGPCKGPVILDILYQHRNNLCHHGACSECARLFNKKIHDDIKADPTFDERFKYWLEHVKNKYTQ